MSGDYVTNLHFFAQCLSECLVGFQDLADNCPKADSVDNDFLSIHLASVIEFLNNVLYLVRQRLVTEVNDD